ncbi:hypothetical protein HK102_011714 [Quaeritorhiza haematococci]|nr:hypothetical protein HK102_011714 [Quaeritorhiza haematococci]
MLRKDTTRRLVIGVCSHPVQSAAFSKTTSPFLHQSRCVPLFGMKPFQIRDSTTSTKASPARWTEEEREKLRKAVKKYPSQWERIADRVGTRTAGSCVQQWKKISEEEAVTEVEAVHRSKWTKEEDRRLAKAVKRRKKDWTLIAKDVGNRDSKQCKSRWKRISSSAEEEPTNEELVDVDEEQGQRRIEWTAEEDAKLQEAIDIYRTKWARVAKHVATRDAESCKLRWNEVLLPELATLPKSLDYSTTKAVVASDEIVQEPIKRMGKRSAWTPEEDQLLRDGVALYGKDWRVVAAHIGTRNAKQTVYRWKKISDSPGSVVSTKSSAETLDDKPTKPPTTEKQAKPQEKVCKQEEPPAPKPDPQEKVTAQVQAQETEPEYNPPETSLAKRLRMLEKQLEMERAERLQLVAEFESQQAFRNDVMDFVIEPLSKLKGRPRGLEEVISMVKEKERLSKAERGKLIAELENQRALYDEMMDFVVKVVQRMKIGL